MVIMFYEHDRISVIHNFLIWTGHEFCYSVAVFLNPKWLSIPVFVVSTLGYRRLRSFIIVRDRFSSFLSVKTT